MFKWITNRVEALILIKQTRISECNDMCYRRPAILFFSVVAMPQAQYVLQIDRSEKFIGHFVSGKVSMGNRLAALFRSCLECKRKKKR